jgi:AraC family transcriptional regulator of adaptative response/methylated-DNA-[protein]-cysteine methyltransferase
VSKKEPHQMPRADPEVIREIEQTARPLSEIAFTAAGFRSIGRFNAAFRATYGRPPSSFRRATR